MKLTALVSGTLLSTLMLTACGSGSVTVSALKPEQIKSGVQSLQAVKNDGDELKPIKLEPISTETVQQQARLRTEAKSAKTVSDKSTPSAEDSARIRKLIEDAQSKIAEEDRAHEQAGFSVKSAGHGEDVDIKLFLYHPKYGDKAKSWGIDNAAEFLEAAKSPWRRWTLKLKLEGARASEQLNNLRDQFRRPVRAQRLQPAGAVLGRAGRSAARHGYLQGSSLAAGRQRHHQRARSRPPGQYHRTGRPGPEYQDHGLQLWHECPEPESIPELGR